MRKLINFLLLVMISFILYSCNVNQDDKIEFNESNEKVWSHYGPPGYGEEPDNDEKRYPFILQLDDPIKIIAEDTDVFNSSISDVSEIQLVLKGVPYVDMAKKYKNKRIKIQATLFSAFEPKE